MRHTRAVGLASKLAIGPAMILVLFAGAFGAEGPALRGTIFEEAMAPMIAASIVAIEPEPDPPVLTLMLGEGISRSSLTLASSYALQWY